MWGLLEVRRGVSVLFQEAHLGAAIPDPLHAAIQWRLLFPLIGHVLGLAPVALFGLAEVGCVLALGLVVVVLRRRGVEWGATAAITVLTGAGSWFFASVCWLGYYDSWLVLGLLIVAFADTDWAVWVACLWAPWVDERFVIGFPLALLCRYLDLRFRTTAPAPTPYFRAASGGRGRWMQRAGIPIALVALFVFVRLVVLAGASAPGARVGGYLSQQPLLNVPLSRLIYGAWEGLRVGWVLVAVAIWGVTKRSRSVGLLLAVATAVLVVIGLAGAQDLSRSMAILIPVAVLGGTLLGRGGVVPAPMPRVVTGSSSDPQGTGTRVTGRNGVAVMGVGAALALILPAHLVMTDRANPIFYLYHELAALQNPPAAAMPELYELRGILAMEDGNTSQAESDLGLAIALSPDPTGPCRQRGMLFASQGRWAEARKDFASMIQHEPNNPDAWYLRSEANLALGDSAAAHRDFDRANAVGGVEWASRPDVKRYRAKLEAVAPAP